MMIVMDDEQCVLYLSRKSLASLILAARYGLPFLSGWFRIITFLWASRIWEGAYWASTSSTHLLDISCRRNPKYKRCLPLAHLRVKATLVVFGVLPRRGVHFGHLEIYVLRRRLQRKDILKIRHPWDRPPFSVPSAASSWRGSGPRNPRRPCRGRP